MRFKSSPLKVGERAPQFSLPDQDGQIVSLDGLLEEGPIVLYFYPKAGTPVCTKEACGFQAQLPDFHDAGVLVVGISGDEVADQKAFHDKHGLDFPLLSDSEASVHNLFGLRSSAKLQLINDRVTFVIDSSGVIRHVSSGLLAADPHIEESLAAARALD